MKFRPMLESLTERIVPDANAGTAPDPDQPPADPAPQDPPLDQDTKDELNTRYNDIYVKGLTTLSQDWKAMDAEAVNVQGKIDLVALRQQQLTDAIQNGVQAGIDAAKAALQDVHKDLLDA